MKKWKWVSETVARTLNSQQITEHGGTIGVRDQALLESALARPENLVAYGQPDVFDLAASYAYGLINNHPFIDGNKRTGLICALVFLGNNGWKYKAPKVETYMIVIALTQKEVDEKAFAHWLRNNSTKMTE